MPCDGAPAPSVSVVVPVYNSATTLDLLVDRVEKALSGTGRTFEMVLVDDGSRDGSWAEIVRLGAERPWVRGLSLMRNYGQHNALLAGIRAAVGGTVVTLDDDLQNPPEEIPLLLAELDAGYDVVYGTPNQAQHGLWRNLASMATKLALQVAMGAPIARKVSPFRAFRSELRAAFRDFKGPHVSVDVLLTWATTRFSAVVVRHDIRLAGESQYTFWKLLSYALDMTTGFSTVPLRLASVLGLGCSALGAAVLALVLVRYLVAGSSVPGFPFLASAIAIFSGAQLFALGIVGEYLARVHFRTMDKPAYVVRRRRDLPASTTVPASGPEPQE